MNYGVVFVGCGGESSSNGTDEPYKECGAGGAGVTTGNAQSQGLAGIQVRLLYHFRGLGAPFPVQSFLVHVKEPFCCLIPIANQYPCIQEVK